MCSPLTMSESWRRRYERITNPIAGDHRQSSCPSIYPYFKDEALPKFSESYYLNQLYPWCPPEINWTHLKMERQPGLVQDGDMDITRVSSNVSDDIQTTWNSVLLAGKHILDSVQKPIHADKPTLKQVLNILEKAYSLPKPEDAFVRRDTLSKVVCSCMNCLMDHVDICRNGLSELIDATFSLHSDGVDLTQIRKVLNKVTDKAPLVMEEFEVVQHMLEEALSWESKLIHISEETEVNYGSEELRVPQLTLSFVETLAHEGKALSLRPRSLVLLEDQIEKAHVLKSKICRWKKVCIIDIISKRFLIISCFSVVNCFAFLSICRVSTMNMKI